MKFQTPYHVINLDKLNSNLDNSIAIIRKATNSKIYLSVKGFSSDVVLSLIRGKIDGISASSFNETKLGRDIVNKTVFTFSPAYQQSTFYELIKNSDIISFNSLSQYQTFSPYAINQKCSCGLRINPEYSALPAESLANPCRRFSRLGIKINDMPSVNNFERMGVEGIHVHSMCEQNADELEKTIHILVQNFDKYLRKIQWLNLGGGQLYSDEHYDITRAVDSINYIKKKYDIDIFLEPCSGIMMNTGCYVTSIVDIVCNEKSIAIVDGSSVCHMPDVAYGRWSPSIQGASKENEFPYLYCIAGSSCYAGDCWGDYYFPEQLKIGDHIIFENTADYNMVKSSFFNGIPLPGIAVYSEKDGLKIIKTFDYDSFLISR